ncbi:hypothetical protein [Streptomyces sp. NPDC047974]|uniref:hypothetical protein n=1 Tax=Streptomyces sp. NPDC047974 TaxID=3154343 RepID=UPI0033FBAFCF
MDVDVERVTDELYGLRPADFTAARDAYVAEARRAKDTAAAKAIAALRRPPLAVWAANLLARERPGEAERFLALGEALREAHRTLDGERLREASRQQHRLVGALVRTTAGLAEEAGQPASDVVLGDVERILHAVLALPDVAGPWAKGRLAAMPEAAVGFPAAPPDTLAARTPAAPPEQPEGHDRKAGERAEHARAAEAKAKEARAGLARRERDLDSAREAERAAAAAAGEAADRLRRAESEREDARTAAAAAEETAQRAGTGLRAAERAVEEARSAVEAAEAASRRHRRDA